MSKKEELARKIQELKSEYTSGSITKEEYAKRVLEIKRDLELLKRETYEGRQKSFNKKLLVIPLLIILILPVSYFLLKENVTESKNSDIYVLKNEGESWPTLQGNPQRTGVVHGEIPDNVELKWKFEAIGVTGIVCAYGRVYFGDIYGTFYCLDGETGEVIWKFHPDIEIEQDPTELWINSPPAVWDKKVYFYNRKGYTYCLSAVDGSKVWEYKVMGVPMIGRTAVIDGKFYMICGDTERSNSNNVICLDANTGKLIWNYKSEKDFNEFILTIGGGKIFLKLSSLTRNSIMCIDKDSGELLWQKNSGELTNKIIIYSDEKIYFWSGTGSYREGGEYRVEGKWYCLNAGNGETIWEKEYRSSTGIVFNEKLYLTLSEDEKRYLYCINCNTGEIIWKKEVDYSFYSPIMDGKKISFVGIKNLMCISAETGEELWRWEHGQPLFLAYMDKKIYCRGDDDYVYCIGER